MNPLQLARERGLLPWLFPLRGKLPIMDAWQKRPPATEEDISEWLAQGYNLGLRCGSRSGVWVIDNDQGKHPDGPKDYNPPETGMVIASPTGSEHYYYVWFEGGPRNSTSKLAPRVDVRGEGGYVVWAGSRHPESGELYTIKQAGEPATCPTDALAALAKPSTVRIDTTRPAEPEVKGSGYAETALAREVHRVRTAPEGSRNAMLNTAAFSLGQLVGGGELSQSQVHDELQAAANLVGLEEREIEKTIQSGIAAGIGKPRKAPERPQPKRVRQTKRDGRKPDILVPGSHILAGGEYVEQGCDTFARQVLDSIPAGTLYRRAGTVGRISDSEFITTAPDRMRSVLDEHVRLVAGKPGKDGEDPTLIYRPCSGDAARLVASYAETDGEVRELVHIAAHPVLVGEDFELAVPGWNEESRTYMTSTEQPIPLDLAMSKAVLEDLVVDFPFASPADRANFFGLMLTPLLRPALREPVPMHLVVSPIERTGKSKLVSIVYGISITGHPLADAQLGVREEEREKRITALLLSGASCAHLDNLTRFIDSPALASLLTSTRYQGRELNYSRMLTLPNNLTIAGTGNNVQATGEIAKRIVPISLQSPLESPETRSDYVHPDLRPYVEQNRPRVLGALLGLVEAWKSAGRPRGVVPMGGFERWAAVVGGIMQVAGYPEWMGNVGDWRGGSNEFGGELAAFVEAWEAARGGREWVPVSELYDLADRDGLFERELDFGSEHGRRTAFSQRVMSVIAGRVVSGGKRVELTGKGKRRRARLVLGDSE